MQKGGQAAKRARQHQPGQWQRHKFCDQSELLYAGQILSISMGCIMPKKIAVAVIHGMGKQAVNRPQNSEKPTFSKGLHKFVRRFIGAARFDSDVAWREITWSQIMQKGQNDYLRDIKSKTRSRIIRKFVLNNLADAASYRQPHHGDDKVYELVHSEVTRTIAELAGDVDDGTPLVILAHSLGGHVISNYIYDMTMSRHAGPRPPGFRGLHSMEAFVTFGCNIPIFTFAYQKNNVKPIRYPGDKSPADRLKVWWRNYYDKDDVLGYPLRPTSRHYGSLAGLKDYPIDAGLWPASWTLLSHNAYWKDPDLYEPVAKMLIKLAK